MSDPTPAPRVVVTDVQMPFGSMIVFMIKWAIASIPAFLILLLAGAIFWVFVVAMFLSAALGTSSLSRSGDLPVPGSQSPPRQTETAAAETEAQAYLSKVELIGIKVGDGLTGRAVFGEVKNTGGRALRRVEITVYCLGPDGKAVFEKTYTPVLVSSLAFSNDNTPLKPGYSRKFGMRLDDAPSDWSGKVDVRVTAVEFAEAGGG